MKNFHRLGTALALSLILTLHALAGEISTTVVPQPTPPAAMAEGQITTGIADQTDVFSANGQISTGAPASDSIVEAVLSLVQGVLSLF